MTTVNGTMATDRPERYAKQLVGHWAKRGPVTTEDGATVQRWDTGQVIALRPGDGVLEVEITVIDGDDAARFAQVGDLWAARRDHAFSLEPLLALADTDVENGLGDMPYPPNYPKMPGEPKRVQPSRARND